MLLDILVGAIVIITMVRGYRHGFLENALNTFGWLIGLVVSFVVSPLFKNFLIDNTQWDEAIYLRVSEKTQEMFSPTQVEAGLPDIIQESFAEFTQTVMGNAADSLATSLSMLWMSVLSFVILTVICNLAFKMILATGSKKKSRNIIGTVDGFVGLMFGFVKGIIYVFIVLALLFPVATMAKPETYTILMDSLYASNIALELYDNNLLMLVIEGLLH